MSSYSYSYNEPEPYEKLHKFLNESALVELASNLQAKINDIFKDEPAFGSLRGITKDRIRKYDCLHEILSPTGSMFNAMYRLMSNQDIKYKFPTSKLPLVTQEALLKGDIPILYNDKVPRPIIPGKITEFINLNPFEYYFFSFFFDS